VSLVLVGYDFYAGGVYSTLLE